MPIRRPRTPLPTLRHLALFEALARVAPHEPEARSIRATLLTLRLVDEWQRSGAAVVAADSRTLLATREAVQASADDAQLTQALERVIDAMVLLQDPDPSALQTRLAALYDLLDGRGLPTLEPA